VVSLAGIRVAAFLAGVLARTHDRG
jgi:hypothetical protein